MKQLRFLTSILALVAMSSFASAPVIHTEKTINTEKMEKAIKSVVFHYIASHQKFDPSVVEYSVQYYPYNAAQMWLFIDFLGEWPNGCTVTINITRGQCCRQPDRTDTFIFPCNGSGTYEGSNNYYYDVFVSAQGTGPIHSYEIVSIVGN